MHVKLLGQFRQGLLTLDGSQRYFRLEHRRVVAAGSSRHGRSCSRPYWPPSGTKSTYPAVQFSRATSEFADKRLAPRLSDKAVDQKSVVLDCQAFIAHHKDLKFEGVFPGGRS